MFSSLELTLFRPMVELKNSYHKWLTLYSDIHLKPQCILKSPVDTQVYSFKCQCNNLKMFYNRPIYIYIYIYIYINKTWARLLSVLPLDLKNCFSHLLDHQ